MLDVIIFLGALGLVCASIVRFLMKVMHVSFNEKFLCRANHVSFATHEKLYGVNDIINKASKYKHLNELADFHEVAASMSKLINEDGAGAWPPNSSHDQWPAALSPYKQIYFEIIPLLSTDSPSLDDNVNHERRARFRSVMQKLLAERVNIPQVVEILAAAEMGNWHVLPRDAYNGWATIPVVKVAQLERFVDFPQELDAPWAYLQRNFGVDADAGNNTSNVLLNFNTRGERIYRINVGMNDVIKSSEEVFFQMFYDVELVGFPIYYEMVLAITTYSFGDFQASAAHLSNVNHLLRDLFRVFYDNLTKEKVSHSVWLSYVQGFQGWGVGKMINGKYVKYDGLSGNHVLIFQALDAFLGMDTYLTPESMALYIPANQRALCQTLKRHSFRNLAGKQNTVEIDREFAKMANQLKVFRAAHRARVMSYLQQSAPERLPMTAGKSVLATSPTSNSHETLKPLDDMLVKRFKETAAVCQSRTVVASV